MYSYITTAVIVFLTHQACAAVSLSPGIIFGAVHTGLVLLLQLGSEGSAPPATAIEYVYWAFFFIWAYIRYYMALAGR